MIIIPINELNMYSEGAWFVVFVVNTCEFTNNLALDLLQDSRDLWLAMSLHPRCILQTFFLNLHIWLEMYKYEDVLV